MLRTSIHIMLPALALLATAFCARPGHAQTVPVEAYYAVVTQDDVPLKAGDMEGYYHVAMLDQGEVLRVTGEGGGWARVQYPRTLPVFVKADEVGVEQGGAFVVLTRESGLKSVNQAGGFGSSWQRAMPRGEDAPIGTRMRVYSVIRDDQGDPVAYAVRPPEGARAYIRQGSIRRATPAEVQQLLQAQPAADDAPAEAPAEEPEPGAQAQPPAEEPAPEQAQPPTTEPAAEEDAEPEEGVSLIEPIQRPGEEQPPAEGQPATGETDQPSQDGVTRIDQGRAAAERERLIGTLTQLSELFNQVQRQDSDTAELDELAAELRRAISAQGDDPVGRRVAEALRQRLQFVETRIAARDTRRELRQKREAIDATYSAIGERIRELESARGYQFVGRLVRSSVYDGNRLPLMYRIVSVNESVPRTIGYIAPEASDAQVEDKLGEVVGVLGTSTLDPDLNLRIVRPTRVDVLAPERLMMLNLAPAASGAGSAGESGQGGS